MSEKEQRNSITYARRKVAALFAEYPVPAHGIAHVSRVADHATFIAQEEGHEKSWLCALAGWLHDIGRVPEKYTKTFSDYDTGKTHHELSYEMLRMWFREDAGFSALSDEEKKELLYAVRYHYNDAARAYTSAIILRDADKIDALGEVGIQRGREFHKTDAAFMNDLRYKYEMWHCLRTKTAQTYAKERHLLAPVEAVRSSRLAKEIEDIEL